MYSRDKLKIDVIYKESSSGTYFYTPDGIGVIWFDTLKEAREQTGIEGRVTVIAELADY